jgi:hypothetical protein
MFDVPTRLEDIACRVLFMQGTADPLVSMQSPRFLAFVRHAQLQCCGSSKQRPRRRTTAEGCQHSDDPGQLA